MRATIVCLLAMGALLLSAAAQQAVPQSETVCTYQDGKHITVRYNREEVNSKGLPVEKIWEPGGSPMYLFSETELTIGTADLPMGAYSLYVIPGKEEWTLVVNKNVTPGSKYDEQDDVVRVPMQTGKLSEPGKNVVAYLAHDAPKGCSLRIDYGATRAWAEIKEK